MASDGRVEGEGLAVLYLRHAPGAVRLAYLLTGDQALAEDLAQEAFVRVCGRLVYLRNPGAFNAYLRKTVVNLYRMHLRRERVERTYLQRELPLWDEATPDPNVAGRHALWQAIRRLPARQRAAIVLRFYEELSEAQTAQALGCRTGTVKSLVSRGMATLREAVSSE